MNVLALVKNTESSFYSLLSLDNHSFFCLQDTKLPHLAGINPHGAHIDVNSRNEMYQPPHPYTNPQAPQPNQQFPTVPLSQRPFYPAPPPQAPSSHFSYSNPVVQQRPQHPYPQPYKLPSHPDGPRQYHTDDKWRMQSNDFSANNLHGPWMNGVRSSFVPVPSFAHEGTLGFLSLPYLFIYCIADSVGPSERRSR